MLYSMYATGVSRSKEQPLFNRIEAARLKQDLSRQALADAVGVHYQTVGYIERGEYSPSLALALRLADVLGCSVHDLFSEQPFRSDR